MKKTALKVGVEYAVGRDPWHDRSSRQRLARARFVGITETGRLRFECMERGWVEYSQWEPGREYELSTGRDVRLPWARWVVVRDARIETEKTRDAEKERVRSVGETVEARLKTYGVELGAGGWSRLSHHGWITVTPDALAELLRRIDQATEMVDAEAGV